MEGTRMLLELTNRKGRLPHVKVSKIVIYKYIIILRKMKRLTYPEQNLIEQCSKSLKSISDLLPKKRKNFLHKNLLHIPLP